MASVSWFYQDGGLRSSASVDGIISKKFLANNLKISIRGPIYLLKKLHSLPCIKCEKKKPDEPEDFMQVSVERYPYHSYMDSMSGQMEPASGARASIPSHEYWPEGTSSRVRAAQAPEPSGVSTGKPSFGKKPGSRRKKHKPTSTSASESSEVTVSDQVEAMPPEEDSPDERKELVSDYVVYQTEPNKDEELSGYDLDKKIGRPHAFINPKNKKPVGELLTSEELWWHWRKPEKEQWSRWQRRRPDSETVFLKAMAETGQVKLYGDHPTLTECSLYRARRHIYKEERLETEKERLEEIGPIAYYSEWVEDWKRDTSHEAIKKHFEETGEDENAQLTEMFMHQTDREYRIMMGTDTRVRRNPLAMRMREDQIKQIWGGDPIYPTVNYIQDPDEVIDYRGPDFHEPTPNMLDYLKEHGYIITQDELDEMLGKEKTEELERLITEIDEAMASAVDIGENEDEEEDSEAENDDEVEKEKITRNWSILKINPEQKKTKAKPTKNNMSLEEAVDDSENLTDFLLDFEPDE